MIRKLLIYLNFLLITGLLVSALSCAINPKWFSYMSLAGLLFPLFVILNVLMMIFWLFSKKKLPALLSLISLLALFPLLNRSFGYVPFNFNKGDVKIISYNAKNFDMYKWSGRDETRMEMLQMLKNEKPDILCIQEFHTQKAGRLRNLEFIKKEMGLPYVFFNESNSFRRDHYWGVAIFSKHPLTNKQVIEFEGSRNQCIYADVEINGKMVRLFNTHLESIHLDNEDYKYIDQVTEDQNTRSTKKITDKFRSAAKKRAEQAKKIVEVVKQTEGEKIIVGDFNDTPISFSYQLLSNGMNDSFSKKGFGIGNTYISKYSFFRIDHILMSKGIKIESHSVIHEEGSDHYPIAATFSF